MPTIIPRLRSGFLFFSKSLEPIGLLSSSHTKERRISNVPPNFGSRRCDRYHGSHRSRSRRNHTVTSLDNEVAKQKIALARMIGLPPNNEYDLADDVPFLAAPDLGFDEALKQAFERRTDIKAAEAQIHAAEHSLSAARDERLPSLSVSGNYGAIGTNPSQAHTAYAGAATLSIPIFQGVRTEGEVTQAKASLAQRRAELEDTRSQVESDVRSAYLDLRAATSQVKVAQRNLQVTSETLDLTRQRFDAGVTDNVEVVQAQESLTSAELDVINSVFAHNVAKLSLARSIASAADNLQQFLSLQ
jgi:outer membrane protein TolC